jgi:hypothetical protein
LIGLFCTGEVEEGFGFLGFDGLNCLNVMGVIAKDRDKTDGYLFESTGICERVRNLSKK